MKRIDMKKNLKLIVLIAVLTTSFFLVHKTVNSDQYINHSSDESGIVLSLGNETSYYPIHRDRETQLRFLDEQIENFKILQDINKKIYDIEMELRTEIAKDSSNKKIIAKLAAELSDLNSNLVKIHSANKMKLKEILYVDSKGFIGRGPIMIFNR